MVYKLFWNKSKDEAEVVQCLKVEIMLYNYSLQRIKVVVAVFLRHLVKRFVHVNA